MPALFALATSVGLLAVLDTWLFFGPLATTLVTGLVWTSFIAWGCHFHSGGGTKGSTTAVVCMSWGALVGMAAVMLASGPFAGLGGAVAPAIAVGIGAAVICLSSKLPILATIPASVYGFAAIAGPIILRRDAPEKAIIPTILAVIIGAIFGYVSEMLANALTKKSGPSAEATATGAEAA
jgi:hypothetical protein